MYKLHLSVFRQKLCFKHDNEFDEHDIVLDLKQIFSNYNASEVLRFWEELSLENMCTNKIRQPFSRPNKKKVSQ